MRQREAKQERLGLKMLRHGRELGQIKSVSNTFDGPGLKIEDQHTDQHQRTAEHRIQEKFDRSIFPPRPTPDANQEIHRQQHQFPEDEEQEEVHGAENARHGRIQQQEQGEITLLGPINIPRGQNANRAQKGSQQNHRYADAVDANKIANIE